MRKEGTLTKQIAKPQKAQVTSKIKKKAQKVRVTPRR